MPASRSRAPRPTRRCWPRTPRTPRSPPARPRSRAPSTQSSRTSPPCSFPAAGELLTRRPGRGSRSRKQRRSQPASGGSSLCCAGQLRRHAEHHGRLLLHCSSGRGPQLRCWPTTPRRKWTRCWSTTERGRRRTPRRPAPSQLRCWPTTPRRKWTHCWPTTARRTHRRRLPSRARCWPTGRARTRTFSRPPDHLGAGGVPLGCRPGHGNGLEHRRRPAQLLHHRAGGRFADRQTWSCGGSFGPGDSHALPGQRLQRGPGHPHRGGSERRRLHPDLGSEPLEHRTHLQPDTRPGAPLRLPPTSWCTCPRPTTSTTPCTACTAALWGIRVSGARPRCTSPSSNKIAKLHFGAHFQAPGLANQTAGTVDVYGLQILDATLEAGNSTEVEADTTASALLLKHEFLDGGADDVTLATLGEVLLEPNHAGQLPGALQQPELRGLWTSRSRWAESSPAWCSSRRAR